MDDTLGELSLWDIPILLPLDDQRRQFLPSACKIRAARFLRPGVVVVGGGGGGGTVQNLNFHFFSFIVATPTLVCVWCDAT